MIRGVLFAAGLLQALARPPGEGGASAPGRASCSAVFPRRLRVWSSFVSAVCCRIICCAWRMNGGVGLNLKEPSSPSNNHGLAHYAWLVLLRTDRSSVVSTFTGFTLRVGGIRPLIVGVRLRTYRAVRRSLDARLTPRHCNVVCLTTEVHPLGTRPCQRPCT